MGNQDAKRYEQLQRRLFRQTVSRLWNMVKAGRLEELTAEERKLAEIILYHQEYADHFENIDIMDGREYEAGEKFNPFFHISIHRMVEDQLSSNSPIEAASFCEAMESKGLPRHEAIHYIMMILVHVIYASATTGKPFDANRYKQLLTECRDVEPSEMDGVVQGDSSSRKSRKDLH